MIKTYHPPKTSLAEDEVFVFTSNLDGFSGAGCSKDLRTAIDRAMLWRPEQKAQSSYIDQLTAKSIAEKALKTANQND